MNPRRLASVIGVPVLSLTMAGCGYSQAKKDKALITAIQAGSPDAVRTALLAGANPNASINDGKTSPLLLAIATKSGIPASHQDIIDQLLVKGADPARQQNDGWDALYIAVAAGDANLCSRFCKAGISPLRTALSGNSAFHIAALEGDTSCLMAMLPFIDKKAVDTPSTSESSDGDSALFQSCEQGHLGASKLLLEHGANPNLQNKKGFNPLVTAAMYGGNDLVELLLAHGAKVDLPCRNGATALSFASLDGHLDVMRTLIAHGADLNIQNKSGVTPMMDAAMKGHHDAVEVLLKAGARGDIRDHKGLTAKDYEKSADPRTMDSVRDRGEG